MPLIQITAPSETPVSVQEVKDAARIDDAAFDAQIAILIKALTGQAESLTGRVFVNRDLELVIDAFPTAEIDLLLPLVQSIAYVKYVDTSGNTITLASNKYTLDNSSTPCWLIPAQNTTWPDTLAAANAVKIKFTAGYGAAIDVPAEIKLWIIARCAELVRNPDGVRGADVRGLSYIDGLLDPFRVMRAV